jgi:sigma54-dependent transcription regulator
MEALRQERVITPRLESTIGLNGLRENDEFIIDIFQERKRSFKLNRTKYKIKSGKKFDFDFANGEITMPFYGKEEGLYEMELVSSRIPKRYSDKSRYIFRSLDKNPFRINGIYCFEAFIERGDVLDIGLSRIHFPKPAFNISGGNYLSDKVVKSSISVLIEGETGTGKTTLAKKIHDESGRRGRFVHLNLSAFSAGLVESELFGHVRGAFTGAINGKRGAILEAHRGTLFLDEVDSLTLDLQTKLLLFLDNHEVRAVGGESTIKADVRIIFASGTKLMKRVEAKQMRRDFYFRLQAGCALTLESLRENPSRVLELCREFENKEIVVIDKELLSFYKNCIWPGNIRQLQFHLIKKKILSNGRKLIFDDLDKELAGHNGINKVDQNELFPLEKMKVNYCHEVFLKMDKNVTRAAKVLQMCPNTLKSYLSKVEEEDSGDHQVIHVNF